MNSRFRFRVWDKEAQKMIYDNFVIRSGMETKNELANCGAEPLQELDYNQNDAITNIVEPQNIGGASWSLIDWSNWYGIQNYIIMQGTSHLDLTNQLIFEGDIVRLECSSDVCNDNYKCCDTCINNFDFEVIWNTELLQFQLHNDTLTLTFDMIEQNDLLIVGNKYEK